MKIGDRVKIVTDPDLDHKIGDIGVIVEKNNNLQYDLEVNANGTVGYYDTDEVELINHAIDSFYFKVQCTTKQSKALQKAFFEIGGSWYRPLGSENKIRDGACFLYVDKNFLTWSDIEDYDFFITRSHDLLHFHEAMELIESVDSSTTITLADGTKVELSRESYQKLVKAANKQ